MRTVKILLLSFLMQAAACTQGNGKYVGIEKIPFKKENKMDEAEFWKIIESTSVRDSNEERSAQMINELSTYEPRQIVEFEIILEKLLIKADDFKVMAAEKIIDGSVSDDPYLYFRCWLIGLGKKTFEGAVNSPEYLAGVVEKGVEPDFESLLYVATKAYENKTGKKKEDDSYPREVAYKAGLNYDMSKHVTAGKDWKEEELPKLYPKLWAKFN